MVEIKRDLKSTVGDVNAIAEALKHLQGVATSLFGVLGNLTETFGNQMGRAVNTVAPAGSGPAQFFTEKGVAARDELARHLAEASERDFQAAAKLRDEPDSPNIVIKEGHGIEIAGAHVRSAPRDPFERQKMFEAMHRTVLGDVPESEIVPHLKNLGVGVVEKKTETQPSYLGPRDLSGVGYSVSDLARVSREADSFRGQKEQGEIANAIKKLSERSDDASKTLAITLKQLQQTVAENSTKLADATRAYKEAMEDAQATPQQKEAARQTLLSTMGAFDKSAEEARNIVKYTGGGGGDDEEGAGRSRLSRIQRYTGAVGAALGLAGAAAQTYMQAGLSMDKAVFGGELKYAQATGNIAQREHQTMLEAHDMTKAENLLRYRADVLMPGMQFDYIGTKGTQNAVNVARGMVRLQTEIEQQERRMALTEAGTSTAQGLLKLGAGAAALLTAPVTGGLGLVMGGGLVASGLGDVIGGTRGGINSWITSPTTALEGGLGQGAIGALGRLRRGDQWDRMADFAQKAAVAQRVDQMGSLMRELQDAEMKKLGPQHIAINEVLDMVKAQQEGAVLVGEYAARHNRVLGRQYEPFGRISADEKVWRERSDSQDRLTISGGEYSEKAKDAADKLNLHRRSLERRLKAAKLSQASLMEDIEDDPSYAKYKHYEGLAGGPGDKEGRLKVFLEKHPELSEKLKLKKKIDAQVQSLEDASEQPLIPRDASDADLQLFMENEAEGVVMRGVENARVFNKEQFKKAVSGNESGGKYDIWNLTGRSDAYGKYQFIGSVREQYAKRLGIEEKQFHLKGDPTWDAKAKEYQEKAMDLLIEDNLREMRKLRADPALKDGKINQFSDFQLMLGIHHRGSGTSKKAIAAGLGLRHALLTGHDPFEKPGHDIHVFDYMARGAKAAGMAPAVGDLRRTDDADAQARTQETSRMGMLARLEMTGAEFMRYQNLLTNALGPGTGMAGDAATARMIQLGRSGMGSFEQQLGNLTALNRVAGGRDNTDRLEKVLTEAVAQGFDKSRTAQAFVQQTLQVMQSLGLTSTSTTGMMLGHTARLMGGGVADERTLGEAARGMEQFGRFTGQTEGIPGALKYAAALRSGIGLGEGAATLSRSNLPEMNDMIEQIRTGNLTNKSRQFLELQGGDKQKAINALQSNINAQGSVLRVAMGMMGGFDLSQNIKEMQAAKAAGDTKRLSQLQSQGMAKAYEAGNATQIGAEGAQAWYLQQQVGAGIITEADRSQLERKIKTGNAVFADPAKQRLRAYIDQMVSDFSVNNRRVSRTQYEEYLQSGGAAYTISEKAAKRAGAEGLAGRAITEEALKSGNAQFQRAAQETFGEITKLDLARGAEMGIAALEGQVQSVRIVNFSEMVPALVMARVAGRSATKRDHNK